MISPAQVPSTGVPAAHELAQRLGQPLALDPERHRGGLAAGDHQRVEALEVRRGAHLARLGAEALEHPRVRLEVALEGQDADDQRRLPAAVLEQAARGLESSISMPVIGAPRSREAAATRSGSSKWVVASTTAAAVRSGSSDLKMPEPTNTPSAPSCIISAASAGVAMPPAENSDHGQPAVLGHVAHQVERRLEVLGGGGQLGLVERAPRRRISPPIERMWRTASTTLPVPASPLVRIIAAPSAMRRSASPRLVAPHTNGTLNAHLSMWWASSAGREHLGLVDVVHLERLEHLRLHEVADAGLGHHGDGHGLLDLLDLGGVGHARHAAVGADVGGHALERHHGGGAGGLGHARLLGGDHVHDHAALEHLGEAGLDAEGAFFPHGLHGTRGVRDRAATARTKPALVSAT